MRDDHDFNQTGSSKPELKETFPYTLTVLLLELTQLDL